ncbi:branched-chain amino acid ABC transporter permease [Castellaniella defragrans]|uniref:branched-chain amino acid ABC transporter permease n=1 Tax=Castellaniella defragrans TaxID=75697 RepID=UPI0023F380CB|nr:branched-chain amino acid ABC transporter permease [Castellaniella defragrans]
MNCSPDIFLLEAVLNGVLLAGLLALLSLGLNLVFGVIDVIWICYAEVVMIGMYGVYYFHNELGLALLVACALGVALTAVVGGILHIIVIRPLLKAAPINQLLATGGVLVFLQASATMAFGVEFRNIGVSLGSISVLDMYFSNAKIVTFIIALLAMAGLALFLKCTYTGMAIQALRQDREVMPLIGVNSSRIYTITSTIGGGLAGLAAVLMTLQFDIYPYIGLQFGPLIFLVCVLGGLGNLIGGFIAALIIAQLITLGGSCFSTEWGYAIAFLFFIVVMFIRPQGLLGKK